MNNQLNPDPQGGESNMTDGQIRKDRAYEHLLVCAKRVSNQFSSGRHPSFEQADHLKAAIEALELQKICGHLALEECNCYEN